MATSGESIRKILLAHVQGDEALFMSAARDYVDEQRRQNHKLFAKELEQILTNGRRTTATSNTIDYLYSHSIPTDREKGVPLVDVRQPTRFLDDLVLSVPVKQQLMRLIEEQMRAEELLNAGLSPVNRLLFCGPPGCGKTVASEAIADALSMPLVIVRFDAVISSYLGETAANLRKVFEFSAKNPCVLLLDEFDAVGKERSATDEHGELKRVVAALLQLLDSHHSESVTIAATNHQSLLDVALWRRFGELVMFEPPNQKQREELLFRCLTRAKLEKGISLQKIARSISGASFADVERVALDAQKSMIIDQTPCVTSHQINVAVDRHKARLRIARSVQTLNEVSE